MKLFALKDSLIVYKSEFAVHNIPFFITFSFYFIFASLACSVKKDDRIVIKIAQNQVLVKKQNSILCLLNDRMSSEYQHLCRLRKSTPRPLTSEG